MTKSMSWMLRTFSLLRMVDLCSVSIGLEPRIMVEGSPTTF
jgi:hypothetical protein